MLVFARLLQGVGAGTANPQVIGLIQDTFRGAARVRALGAYAAVGSLSAIAGPVAGGTARARRPGPRLAARRCTQQVRGSCSALTGRGNPSRVMVRA